jgi:8-oxo-dGTP pyrophosphatase MutT (NUDIX family)
VKPVYRPAARILLLDPADRLLLLRTDLRPDRSLWVTPGGGVEQGETSEDAALRELREETGIVARLGPCVWLRRHVFDFNGIMLDEDERFYVVRLDAETLTTDRYLLDHERTFIHEYRWWTAREISISEDWFAPRRLAALLPSIVAGEYPSAPIDCGV